MPITDDIVSIGPKGNKMCYLLGTLFRGHKEIGTPEQIDEIIDLYLGEAKLNHYPGKGMTRDEIKEKGWVVVFCVEDGRFWAFDAQEC